MNNGSLTMTELASRLALALVGLALFLTFVRLVRGPTLPDRVVALDLMGVLAVGMIAAYAVAADQPGLMDPAAVAHRSNSSTRRSRPSLTERRYASTSPPSMYIAWT